MLERRIQGRVGAGGVKALRITIVIILAVLGSGRAIASDHGGMVALTHGAIVGEKLNRDFLRAAFLMRLRVWPDGTPITVFVLDDSDPAHEQFCREVLGTFPYVLRRTWDRMTFTGTGVAPRRVGALDEMRRRVLATPGAIGYTHRSATERSADPAEVQP